MSRKTKFKLPKQVVLNEGEQPIRCGFANLFYGPGLADGGNLVLTNQRLIFVAHSVNLNPNLYLETSLSNIEEVLFKKNMLLSHMIAVVNDEGKEIPFIVYKGKEWVKEIQNAIALHK